MELSTFGSVLTFAIGLEEKSARFYEAGASNARLAPHKAALLALAEGNRKRRELLLTTRRENVTEMVLEPIAGLRAEDYEVSPPAQGATAPAAVLACAAELEARSARFYSEVAAQGKRFLAGVARTFSRLANENESRLAEVKGMGT